MESDIPHLLIEYIRDELHGVYTTELVRVDAYDHDRQRVTVSLKDDPVVTTDNVPVAVPGQ